MIQLLIGKAKLDAMYTFKISIKIQFFDVSIGIKIQVLRVSVTIEPGHSLLTVRYHELFDTTHKQCGQIT